MKNILMVATLSALMPVLAHAQMVDLIGGADGAQTIYHCEALSFDAKRYADTPVLTAIVERKLRDLGYNTSRGGKLKSAVKAFQMDYGLAADGIVGPRTARKLAYASHPSPRVRRCAA